MPGPPQEALTAVVEVANSSPNSVLSGRLGRPAAHTVAGEAGIIVDALPPKLEKGATRVY